MKKGHVELIKAALMEAAYTALLTLTIAPLVLEQIPRLVVIVVCYFAFLTIVANGTVFGFLEVASQKIALISTTV